jgi:hypothetical protein
MQVGAGHGDHDVKVELEFVGDASLNAEVVVFLPRPPGAEFGQREEGGKDEEGQCPLASSGCG